jgi:hypothetical protein
MDKLHVCMYVWMDGWMHIYVCMYVKARNSRICVTHGSENETREIASKQSFLMCNTYGKPP